MDTHAPVKDRLLIIQEINALLEHIAILRKDLIVLNVIEDIIALIPEWIGGMLEITIIVKVIKLTSTVEKDLIDVIHGTNFVKNHHVGHVTTMEWRGDDDL